MTEQEQEEGDLIQVADEPLSPARKQIAILKRTSDINDYTMADYKE